MKLGKIDVGLRTKQIYQCKNIESKWTSEQVNEQDNDDYKPLRQNRESSNEAVLVCNFRLFSRLYGTVLRKGNFLNLDDVTLNIFEKFLTAENKFELKM